MSPEVAKHLLYGYMGDLSEIHWASGWNSQAEFDLWDMVKHGATKWGNFAPAEIDMQTLSELSEAAGGWFCWKDRHVQFIEAEAWKERFQRWKLASQSLEQEWSKTKEKLRRIGVDI